MTRNLVLAARPVLCDAGEGQDLVEHSFLQAATESWHLLVPQTHSKKTIATSWLRCVTKDDVE